MTIHSKVAWKHTRNSMGPLSNPEKRHNNPSQQQVINGKARRKLEDLKDQKALQNYVSEIWDE